MILGVEEAENVREGETQAVEEGDSEGEMEKEREAVIEEHSEDEWLDVVVEELLGKPVEVAHVVDV